MAHLEPPGGTSPTSEVRLYRIAEAARLLSLGRTVVYEQIRAGRLRSVQQGRARLISSQAISDYIELLEREAAAWPERWSGNAEGA